MGTRVDPLQWTAREDLFEEVTFIAEARMERTSQGKTDECSRQRNGVCEGFGAANGLVSLSRSQCGRSRERNGEQTEI